MGFGNHIRLFSSFAPFTNSASGPCVVLRMVPSLPSGLPFLLARTLGVFDDAALENYPTDEGVSVIPVPVGVRGAVHAIPKPS
jgi:hypothetical protein